MPAHKIVSRDEWIKARSEHLKKEKDFTRLRDALSEERRNLPWVRLDQDYVFDAAEGRVLLQELFGKNSQLVIYHFMFDPSWEVGCKSCSFWADNFDGIIVHLKQRDVSVAVVSKAELPILQTFQKRMGWKFRWVSSFNSSFNRDFHVSFPQDERDAGQAYYNYQTGSFPSPEGPGISVFYKDDDGTIYHTYSCYARGLDMINIAYHILDLVPKGRDEKTLPYSMAWVKLHDQY